MLKQRIITALVLLAVLLPALLVEPAWPFALLTLVADRRRRLGMGAPERRRRARRSALGVGLGVACAAGAAAAGWATARAARRLVGGDGASGCSAAPGCCAPAPPAGRSCRAPLRVGARAASLLWTAWLALASAKAIGLNFILSVFCLVWAADIAAYFGGRAFGRRKLAPAISPGKSWEGVWSGMARRAAAGRWPGWSIDGRWLADYDQPVYTLRRRALRRRRPGARRACSWSR